MAVAQLVRVPDCGSGGRGFKSHQPPIFFCEGYFLRGIFFAKNIFLRGIFFLSSLAKGVFFCLLLESF